MFNLSIINKLIKENLPTDDGNAATERTKTDLRFPVEV